MRAALMLALLAGSALAGCLAPAQPLGNSALPGWIPRDVVWNITGDYSVPLEEGLLGVLPVEKLTFPSFDGTRISAAVLRPDVPEGVKVPVVLDIGPYFGDSIEVFGNRSRDLFVKHGFAYGHVAVRGTSSSGGCMEFFSLDEQKDMDATVTHFGTLPWSNGNVGLFGGSYDGTTQWMAAMFGNPHLKTIVPLAALTSIYDHQMRNGTSWGGGPIFEAIYWEFGFDTMSRTPEDKVANAACPEAYRGMAAGPYSTVTGDFDGVGPLAGYWQERDFTERIRQNYRGSVFLVHGLEDWRVPPSMAFPFVTELQQQGIEVKVLLGQWWHDSPDRASRHDSVRWDFAEVLLRWLDKQLYERPQPTGPVVDVEDDLGHWRTEATWPPADAGWTQLYLGDGKLEREPTADGERVLEDPVNAAGLLRMGSPLEYRASLGRVPKELRFAGMPTLHATFVPLSPEGGRVYAELVDVGWYGDAKVVGHAVMDLRYHAGGHERQQLTPGQPVLAKMQFFPLDVVIPPGHELVLRIVGGNGYAPQRDRFAELDSFVPSPTPLPITLQWGGDKSTLVLPEIVRDVGTGKYPGQP